MTSHTLRGGWPASALLLACLVVGLVRTTQADEPEPTCPELLAELKSYPHKILWEKYKDGSWDIWVMNADGTEPRNLTDTSDLDEMYPKASPDGTMIAFVADRGEGKGRRRDVYLMNADGTNRRRIAEYSRQPCWTSDGKTIAYLSGIKGAKTTVYTANQGLRFYDVQSGKVREHVNKDIKKMLCIGLTPDSTWFVSSAVGGLGYGHSIIAFQADGMKHCELIKAEKKFWQCRPDISPCGNKVAYAKAQGQGDDKMLGIEVADLVVGKDKVQLANTRWICSALNPIEVYHADWSPDGEYILCSRGPRQKSKMKTATYVIGVEAKGWNLCVIDANGYHRWHTLTTDGLSNKEPDWLPVRQETRQARAK